MRRWKEKLSKIKMPHTYVILTIILLVVVALCYLIPAGEYVREFDPVSGKTVVIPDSFHFTEGKKPGLFDIFLSLQRGYVDAADILFLIVFAYGYVYILTKNGTLSGAIHVLIRKMKGSTHLLIPVFKLLFGVLGSTLGIFEETYGLVSVFVGMGLALGYDPLVGGAVVYVGVATGFAAATTNPFSVGIAQSIAEVPINSGVLYRLVVFLVFQGTAIWYALCQKGQGAPGAIRDVRRAHGIYPTGCERLRRRLYPAAEAVLAAVPGHHRDAAVRHHSAGMVYQ